MAFNPANRADHYLLVAGHCGPTGSDWIAWRPATGYETIGEVIGRIYGAWGDYATIHANLQWYGTAQPWIVRWNPDQTVHTQSYGLIDRGHSFDGMFGCKMGRSRPIHCGTVLRHGIAVGYRDGTTVGGLTETNACTIGGDSGGPWVSNSYAYGITSGGNSPNEGAGPCTDNVNTQRHWYAEVMDAEALLGVRIVTNATGPA